MRLLSLTLKNFCQYEDRTVGFSPGMTMITGPNGTGKSNLLNGTLCALTGDARQADGVKLANIRHGTPKRAKAGVELIFEHNGVQATAICDFRPSKRSFIAAGMEKEVTGDALVTEAIRSFLGIDNDVLSNYVFVAQSDLFGIFDLTPAKRNTTLQRLYGLERAEAIWTRLGEELVLVPTTTPINLDAIRQERKEADAALTVAQASADAKMVELLDKELAEANQLVRAIQQYEALANELRSAAQAADAVRQQREAAEQAVQAAEARKRTADNAAAILPSLEAYMQRRRQHATTVTEINRLTDSLNRLIRPTKPADYIPAERRGEYETLINDLNGRYTSAMAMINKHAAHGSAANCPTCGQSLAGVMSVVDNAKKESTELGVLLNGARAVLKSSADYDQAVSRVAAVEDSINKDIGRLNAQLMTIDVTPLQGVSEDLAVVATMQRDYSNEQASANAVHESERRRLAAAGYAEQQANARFDKARSAQPPSIPAGVTLDSSLLRVSTLSAQLSDMRVNVANLAIAVDRAARAKEAQETAEIEAVTAREYATKRQGLTGLRQLFHREGLPKLMSADMTRRLMLSTNEFLTEFGPPFTMSYKDNGTFVATFPDGNEQLAGRLSGGQKVVLSLAFRLAVHATFASGIKLICLDEPTAGLDTYNLECLGRAFQRLGAISKSAGLQVVVVTHEKGIAHFFDHVIDLGAPQG